MPMSARACVTRRTLPIRVRSLAAVHPVGRLLSDAAAGRYPPADGGWHRLPQWRSGLSAVLAFTGHAVFAVDDRVSDDTLAALGADGLGGASDPRLVTALAGPTGWIDSLDLVLVTSGVPGTTRLVRRPERAAHPRVRHATAVRDDVEGWGTATGSDGADAVVTPGTGMGGLAEMSLELPPKLRGRGLGRELIMQTRYGYRPGRRLWPRWRPATPQACVPSWARVSARSAAFSSSGPGRRDRPNAILT